MLTIDMHCEGIGLHSLLHSAALVEGLLRLQLAELDITPRQARILDALDRMADASQVQLAREFDLTPASMSTMTVRLLDAGYILRSPHPGEARSHVLRLSDQGQSLLAEVRKVWKQIDQKIEATLGVEKAERLVVLTRELRDKLGGHRPGEPRQASAIATTRQV